LENPLEQGGAMLFHECHFFCGETEVFRHDWEQVHPFTAESVKLYKSRELKKKHKLDALSDITEFRGEVQEYSRYGFRSAICNLFIPNIVGLGCLFLGGNTSGSVWQQRYCANFQKMVTGLHPAISFPLPPLEIASRPLFYYIIFNLDGGDLWKSSAQEAILWANGIGLALLFKD
jgi:hypothetical protein